ncbi:hypothetical protein P3T76_014863 [Phytophthora citrophthora]|uniref:Uncharacterized protein n=1 Tax=Phytophthora citrophthora TaxID=4793 RepID=A0AAD9LAU8_9STRA|nr:hypothetical protein P3T76_014863 [Phytophthora citrophthora]
MSGSAKAYIMGIGCSDNTPPSRLVPMLNTATPPKKRLIKQRKAKKKIRTYCRRKVNHFASKW